MVVARVVVAVIAFIVLVYAGISSSLIQAEMVDDINVHRNPENKISWIWWGPFKRQRVNDEHQDLYPNSNVQSRFRLRILLGLGALVVMAMCIITAGH